MLTTPYFTIVCGWKVRAGHSLFQYSFSIIIHNCYKLLQINAQHYQQMQPQLMNSMFKPILKQPVLRLQIKQLNPDAPCCQFYHSLQYFYLLKLAYCLIQQMQQKSTLSFENENNLRLWRKVNSKPNAQDEKSTEKSLVKTFKSQIKPEPMEENQTKYEPEIAQFLMRIHHKMNDEGQDSQSQILQRLSLEWPEDSFHKSQSIHHQKISLFSEELSLLNQGWRTQRNNCSESGGLKELKNLFQLQAYIAKINPLVAEELQQLMKENQKLSQECSCSRYNDKKTTLKLQLLNNQVHMLDKKNQQLTNENQKLKQEARSIKLKKVDLKIQTNTSSYNFISENQSKVEIMEINTESQQIKEQSNKSEIGNNSKSPDRIQLQQSIELHRNSSTTSTRSNKLLNLNHHDFHSIASEIFGGPKRSARITRKT